MDEEEKGDIQIHNDKDSKKYQMDIKHKFHDTVETFEVYECPICNSHFLVESEALDSIDNINCPYGCGVNTTKK